MWFWIFVIVCFIIYAIANSKKENDTSTTTKYSYKVKNDDSHKISNSFKPASVEVIPDSEVVRSLKGYINTDREIRIRYQNSSGSVTNRMIQPLEILVWKGQYYLKANCLLRGEARTFKINRILSINNEAIEKSQDVQVQLKKKRVLLIEPDEERLKYCKSFLRRNKVPTVSASDGISALDKINKNEFGLIILNQNISYVSGIEILRNIKKRSLTNASVVIVSNKLDEKIKKEAERLGVKDYFIFPTNSYEELTSAIEHYLS